MLEPASSIPVAAGSTSTLLNVGAGSSGFNAGDLVVVDVDYTGTTGFVGSAVSGGYVRAAAAVGNDLDYVDGSR